MPRSPLGNGRALPDLNLRAQNGQRLESQISQVTGPAIWVAAREYIQNGTIQ